MFGVGFGFAGLVVWFWCFLGAILEVWVLVFYFLGGLMCFVDVDLGFLGCGFLWVSGCGILVVSAFSRQFVDG